VELPRADGQPFGNSASVLEDGPSGLSSELESLAQVASEARTLGSRIMIISGCDEADAAEVVSAKFGDDLAWRISEVVSVGRGR
jgi:hypothetical protein